VAVATDSPSTLIKVINPGNREHLNSWIRHFIYTSTNIQFVRIPGNTGFLGNENADAEAKKQLLETDATPEFRNFRRILIACKNRRANVEDNKMKEHKILLSRDRTYLTGSRAEVVFIFRIRIGHTRLTHGYLTRPPPERVQSLCERCRRMLTIKYLFVECTRYDGHRVRLL
jgi:hypothetical protein